MPSRRPAVPSLHRPAREGRIPVAPTPSGRLPRAAYDARSGTLALSRARQLLGLTPGEFALCVESGEVPLLPGGRPGSWRVPAPLVRRLAAQDGHPERLRERLRVVEEAEGAELLDIGPARFARLAASGAFTPVRFTVGRDGVRWHYLARELRQFGEQRPALLHGPLPGQAGTAVRQSEDWRPRLWRSRRMAQLLRDSEDPWTAAAVHAAVLDRVTLERVVPDPVERRLLTRLCPRLVPHPAVSPRRAAAPGGPSDGAARTAELLTAEVGEETRWHSLGLTLALGTARAECAAAQADHRASGCRAAASGAACSAGSGSCGAGRRTGEVRAGCVPGGASRTTGRAAGRCAGPCRAPGPGRPDGRRPGRPPGGSRPAPAACPVPAPPVSAEAQREQAERGPAVPRGTADGSEVTSGRRPSP